MDRRVARIRARIVSRSPESLLVAGFGVLILAGTVLLWLPWSHRGTVGTLEAFFTATSAVCVTGLVVVDTGTDYTFFGQVVILLLIQTGGIGVMSFAAMAFALLGRRLSLNAQAALSNSMLQRGLASEFRSTFWRILRFVLIAQMAGAILLFVGMLPARDAAHAGYSAVFHAVSAFCNAGFSLYPDSLIGWRTTPLVIATVTVLIVLGGIGHPVAVDVYRKLRAAGRRAATRPNRMELHSSVALATSGLLVFGGLLWFFAFGLGPGHTQWRPGLWDGLFQSVTARTAGFNTVKLDTLPPASLMLIVLLMFIGGSPGSCAGGIKTTTFSLWMAAQWSRLRSRKRLNLLGKHIPDETVGRASLIIGLAVVWNIAGMLFLLATESGSGGVAMHDVLFEQVSAFGTVGLSTGITARLSCAGKLWIIATMFVGRLGPLTLAVWAFNRKGPDIRYPEGRIMIG